MQVKRIKNKLHIGTWNVLTLREPGKMQECAEQVKDMRIEILAIQEMMARNQLYQGLNILQWNKR
jgi:hypothetical protein